MSLNKSEMALELANTIIDILKTGLFNKELKTVETFNLPSTIFRDVYISGFVEYFIVLNLYSKYNTLKLWKNAEIYQFTLDVYKGLNFTDEETRHYQKLITDEETRKGWNVDGKYTLGKVGARLCHISKFPSRLVQEKSEIISKAKKKVMEQDIRDNEDYDLKMIAMIYEMTIYNYLKKQFGSQVIKTQNVINDNKVETIFQKDKDTNSENSKQTKKIETTETILDLPLKYREEYQKIEKQFSLEHEPKHQPLVYGILFSVGSALVISFILKLNGIFDEDQSLIAGLVIGGIAYFAQYQNQKNYSKKESEKMIKVENELISKAKYENRQ